MTIRSSRSGGSKALAVLSTGGKPSTARPRKLDPALSQLKLEVSPHL